MKHGNDWVSIAKDMQLYEASAPKTVRLGTSRACHVGGACRHDRVKPDIHTPASPQCRDRYNNYAHPELDQTPCRAEEVLLFIELHKRLGNRWTEIASEMNAAAAAAAEPGAKTRRSENWVKNAFYSKMRKSNKDHADTRWAPLYAYQEACQAEGRDLLPDGDAADAAQLPGAEAAEPVVAPRRSTRVTRKPRYGDYDSGEEQEEEEEEEEEEAELQPPPLWTLPSSMQLPAPEMPQLASFGMFDMGTAGALHLRHAHLCKF